MRQTLRESEKRFRALVENSWNASRHSPPARRSITSIRASLELSASASKKLVGRNAFTVIHPDDVQSVREAFARLSKNPGRNVIIEHRIRHKDGSWLWIEAVATNLVAEPGVNTIVCNYQDITRRRQVEESEERFRVRANAWRWVCRLVRGRRIFLRAFV